MTDRLSRRSLLRGALVTGAAGAAATAIGACSDGGGSTDVSSGAAAPERVAFHGPHQLGVLQHGTPAGVVVALKAQTDTSEERRDALRSLSDAARRIMEGIPPEERESAFPPTDSGVLGPTPPPADLSVIVGFGASLFDERFGLAAKKPRELEKMPFFANDRLNPATSHGDLSLTVSAATPDAAMFALRQLLRATRGAFTLDWMLEGFNSAVADPTPGGAPVRNLLGFKDGTANLATGDAALMSKHVWVQRDDPEPAWAVGGTYQAIRIVRMFVEFWDRTRLGEQEAIIGRVKATGAPLGAAVETDVPDFTGDEAGERTPLDAHIRLANPRTGIDDSLILRRGFSYSRGFDGAGRLDQGLLFASFQRSLDRGFRAVQSRLDGEPLEEYIQPTGGGFFFVPPGTERDDGYWGEGLF